MSIKVKLNPLFPGTRDLWLETKIHSLRIKCLTTDIVRLTIRVSVSVSKIRAKVFFYGITRLTLEECSPKFNTSSMMERYIFWESLSQFQSITKIWNRVTERHERQNILRAVVRSWKYFAVCLHKLPAQSRALDLGTRVRDTNVPKEVAPCDV